MIWYLHDLNSDSGLELELVGVGFGVGVGVSVGILREDKPVAFGIYDYNLCPGSFHGRYRMGGRGAMDTLIRIKNEIEALFLKSGRNGWREIWKVHANDDIPYVLSSSTKVPGENCL